MRKLMMNVSLSIVFVLLNEACKEKYTTEITEPRARTLSFMYRALFEYKPSNKNKDYLIRAMITRKS